MSCDHCCAIICHITEYMLFIWASFQVIVKGHAFFSSETQPVTL